MRYFVGYLIERKAARWHSNLAKEIAEKFGTWKIHERFPPHVTIFQPFETEDVEGIKDFLRSHVDARAMPGTLTLSGYDRFDDRVVFVNVDTEDSVRDFVQTLQECARTTSATSGLMVPAFSAWHPHATLAYRLPPEDIVGIWGYVSMLPNPVFTLPFDNVTLFRFEGDRWVTETTFKFS